MNKTANNNDSITAGITDDIAIALAPSFAPSLSSSSYNEDNKNDIVCIDDYGCGTSGYNEGSKFTFIMGFAFVMLFMIRICQYRKQNERSNDRSRRRRSFVTPVHHSIHTTTSTVVGSGIRLALEDRIELYNKTFDSNGNQLTHKSKHIITKTMKGNGNGNGNDNNGSIEGGVEQKNRSESFVDIELGGGDDNGNNGNDNDDDEDSSIYLSFDSDRNNCSTSIKSITTSTKSLSLDHHHHTATHKEKKNKDKNKISGTCIICFDDFSKDDVIVWSNDSSCNHIYHKECMVTYLANNAQRKQSSPLDITDNPCPTCRRSHYCLVSDDDLVQILSSSSSSSIQPPKVTTTTSATTTVAATGNNSNDDNNSDEIVEEVAASVAASVAAVVVIETATNEESVTTTTTAV